MATSITIEGEGLADFSELPVDAEAQLHALLLATLERLQLAGWYVVSLVLTDDATIRQVNKQYRHIDKATDVLSFPQSDQPLLPLPATIAWTDHSVGDDTHAVADPINPPTAKAVESRSPFTYGTSDMPIHLGDIMISVPTVTEQAQQAHHSFWWEFTFLAVHGLLHLVGYDDYYESGYLAMVAHQEALLDMCNISK